MAGWYPRSLGEEGPEGAGRPVGTRDGAPKPTLSGEAPPSSPSDQDAGGGETVGHAAVKATPAGDGPPVTVKPTSLPSSSDRTGKCPGCKTHQRPGFLCPECSRFVPFPKPSGQSDGIPY